VLGLRDSTSFMNPIVRFINRDLDIRGKLEVGAGGTIVRLLLDGKCQEIMLPLPVQVLPRWLSPWVVPRNGRARASEPPHCIRTVRENCYVWLRC
jgi:hypothetical protein